MKRGRGERRYASFTTVKSQGRGERRGEMFTLFTLYTICGDERKRNRKGKREVMI